MLYVGRMKRWIAALVAALCLAWRLSAPSLPVEIEDPSGWTDLAEAGDQVAALPSASPSVGALAFAGLVALPPRRSRADALLPEARALSPPVGAAA